MTERVYAEFLDALRLSPWTAISLFGCPECAAVVIDRDAHDRFHEGAGPGVVAAVVEQATRDAAHDR